MTDHSVGASLPGAAPLKGICPTCRAPVIWPQLANYRPHRDFERPATSATHPELCAFCGKPEHWHRPTFDMSAVVGAALEAGPPGKVEHVGETYIHHTPTYLSPDAKFEWRGPTLTKEQVVLWLYGTEPGRRLRHEIREGLDVLGGEAGPSPQDLDALSDDELSDLWYAAAIGDESRDEGWFYDNEESPVRLRAALKKLFGGVRGEPVPPLPSSDENITYICVSRGIVAR